MKQVILGGFIFLGGCVLYAISVLGTATTTVIAYEMQTPMYIGIGAMAAGLVLGLLGLRKE